MFAIYCQKNRNCDLLRSVTIAGVICENIISKAASIKPKKNETMPWELSGADLCRAVIAKNGIESEAASCKVVVDATYGRSDALLLEINYIWGFSYNLWTPILLRMTTLFEGDRPKGKATPVERFRLDGDETSIHEFLYLQCGHQGGKKNWGMMGYTNAALLYPDAFAHLLAKVGFVQRSR
jgi:hypothetical protein